MGSPSSDAMAKVVATVAPILKAAGFKKRRHGFNRATDAGIVQVVHFEMGAHMPPGAAEVPPIRVNLYGRFTVNVGVFLAEVDREFRQRQTPTWVNEYDSHLRKRIGHLMPDQADLWWDLSGPSAAASLVRDAVDSYVLPWLDGVRTRDAILTAYAERGREFLGLPPAADRWLVPVRAAVEAAH